jgi:dTDP-4-dehydrorhamnose reductase
VVETVKDWFFMKWLIVGASGQLGSQFFSELSKLDLEIICPSSKDLDMRLSSTTLDYVRSIKPNYIVNCAAWTHVDNAELHPEKAFEVNVTGPLNLAYSSKLCGATFIHFSTDYVFSGERSEPWKELDITNPISTYGKTKAAGEVEVLNCYPENSYIFRIAWLYSIFGNNFAKSVITKALNHEPMKFVNDRYGQPTYAGDVVNRILSLNLKKLPPGIYHATNGGEATWIDFGRLIYGAAGVDMDLVIPIESANLGQIANRPKYSVLSHEKWKRLGIEPLRDWREALFFF